MSEKKWKTLGHRSPGWAFMKTLTIYTQAGNPYLRRLRIIQTPWFGIFLHKIMGPDPDLDLHDHPYNFLSFVLRGGYTERWRPWHPEHPMGRPSVMMPAGYLFHVNRHWGRWTLHYMDKNDIHAIRNLDRKPTWTLLLVGPRTRQWGFYDGIDWIPWNEYERVKPA